MDLHNRLKEIAWFMAQTLSEFGSVSCPFASKKSFSDQYHHEPDAPPPEDEPPPNDPPEEDEDEDLREIVTYSVDS